MHFEKKKVTLRTKAKNIIIKLYLDLTLSMMLEKPSVQSLVFKPYSEASVDQADSSPTVPQTSA